MEATKLQLESKESSLETTIDSKLATAEEQAKDSEEKTLVEEVRATVIQRPSPFLPPSFSPPYLRLSVPRARSHTTPHTPPDRLTGLF